MAKSKYAKNIITELNGQEVRDGKVVFNGIIIRPEQLGTNCQVLYSVVKKAEVNEAVPHIHDFPIIMCFFGANPDNTLDFDAEIEFSMGGEKQIITKPAVISVPAGLDHCPLIFKRVTKPIVWVEIHLTSKYTRRYLGEKEAR
jgi:hypothetical protein